MVDQLDGKIMGNPHGMPRGYNDMAAAAMNERSHTASSGADASQLVEQAAAAKEEIKQMILSSSLTPDEIGAGVAARYPNIASQIDELVILATAEARGAQNADPHKTNQQIEEENKETHQNIAGAFGIGAAVAMGASASADEPSTFSGLSEMFSGMFERYTQGPAALGLSADAVNAANLAVKPIFAQIESITDLTNGNSAVTLQSGLPPRQRDGVSQGIS